MSDLDTRQQSGETLPDVVRKTPLEIPVAEFEGEYIRTMLGKLPAITMEMPVGYTRGTHLKLEIEVRIKDVSVKEVGKQGDLVREHTFALEEIKLIGAYTADEMDPGVGGSAAVGSQTEEDSDDRPETDGEDADEDEGDPDVGF